MTSHSPKAPRKRKSPPRRKPTPSRRAAPSFALTPIGFLQIGGLALVVLWFWWFHAHYTVSLQSPLVVHLQWAVVVSEREYSEDARLAQADQHGHRLSAWQQYACRKFGHDCRLALAIQRAENPQGKCEIYHYNSNGTLDWGYFQINTVHLQRKGLNLRDLLDCKANVDFAYQLYTERGGFTPWSTFNSGAYRKFYQP